MRARPPSIGHAVIKCRPFAIAGAGGRRRVVPGGGDASGQLGAGVAPSDAPGSAGVPALKARRCPADAGVVDRPGDDQHFAAYPARFSELHTARQDWAAWLERQELAPGVVEDLVVVFSELMGNAVAAAFTDDDRVAVHATVADGGVHLEVRNPLPSRFDAEDRWDYRDPLRTGGRGLMVVEALVDDLAIAPPDRQRPLTIRCRRDLRHQRQADDARPGSRSHSRP